MLIGYLIGWFLPIWGIIGVMIAALFVMGIFLNLTPGVLSNFGMIVFGLSLIYFARLLQELNAIRLFNKAVKTGERPDTDWIKMLLFQIKWDDEHPL